MTKDLASYEYDVYISYNRRTDARIAKEVATGLSQYDLRIFFDEWRLTIGDSFSQTILSALDVSRYIIFIISPSELNSLWIEKELAIALNSKTSKVLPVLVDEAVPPPYFEDLNYVHLNSNDASSVQNAIRQIANVIERGIGTTGKLRLRQAAIHEESETLPPLDHRGFLPEGVHQTSLKEIIDRFGSGSKQRRLLSQRLVSLSTRALKIGADFLIIGGSFISGDLNPQDLDVLIVIPDQAADKITKKDLDVIQSYLSSGKSTFIASDKESVQRWTHFLENRLLSEPRGVVQVKLSGGHL